VPGNNILLIDGPFFWDGRSLGFVEFLENVTKSFKSIFWQVITVFTVLNFNKKAFIQINLSEIKAFYSIAERQGFSRRDHYVRTLATKWSLRERTCILNGFSPRDSFDARLPHSTSCNHL
jgi:hypothetical protein